MRRNRVPNPSFEVNTVGWAAVRATATRDTVRSRRGAASVRITATDGSAQQYLITELLEVHRFPVTGGETLALLASVYPEVSNTFAFQLYQYDAGGTLLSPVTTTTYTAAPAGQWTDLSSSLAIKPTAVTARMVFIPGTSLTVGQSYWVDCLAAGTSVYMDGSFSPDPDMVPAWTGTANASASTLTATLAATPITGYAWSSDGSDRCIQSSQWARTGTQSARMISNTAALSYRYIVMNTLPVGTYNLIIPVHLTAAQVAPGPTARTVEYRVDGVTQVISAAFPNTPGDHEMRLTFTKTTDTGTHLIMINQRVPRGDADMWIDDFTLVRAPYGGGAFTGSTQDADGVDYRWAGALNASISQMVLPATPATRPNYCDITWHSDKDEECFGNLHFALEEDVAYEARYLPEEAPWFSQASGYSYPASPSRKFLGAYALSVSSLSDSTREVGITEGILSGGVLGRERLAVPRFRFRVMLTAVDEEGIEYGKAWLSKALSEQSCSTHGPSCGSSDLTFFAACPPARDFDGPMGAYTEKLDSISRMYHDVKCIEGPVTTDTFNRAENSWGAIVEFTLAAGVPNMFGVATEYQPIPLDGETIIQDLPYNYIPYPSAELAGADLTVATNYSLNPSLETNATGWSHTSSAVTGSGPSGYTTSARVTGELAAAGTSSFRVRLLGSGTVAAGRAQVQALQTVDLATAPAGARVSATIWSALIVAAGAGVTSLVSLDARLEWQTSGGVVVGSPISLGTTSVPADFGGIVFAARSLTPPPTATRAQVIVRAVLDWASGATNTDARLYVDALAVTVP